MQLHQLMSGQWQKLFGSALIRYHYYYFIYYYYYYLLHFKQYSEIKKETFSQFEVLTNV